MNCFEKLDIYFYKRKRNIEEYIAKRYLARAKKKFIKYFPQVEVKLADNNSKTYRVKPRWVLIFHFARAEDYDRFMDYLFFDVFGKTYFPIAIRNNGQIIAYVKNSEGKQDRFIL